MNIAFVDGWLLVLLPALFAVVVVVAVVSPVLHQHLLRLVGHDRVVVVSEQVHHRP